MKEIVPQKLSSPAEDAFKLLNEEDGNGMGTGTLTPT